MKEQIPQFQDVFPWVHRAHILWVCLNKCEISNRYCRTMTRFGLKSCHKKSNQFQFQLKICVCPFKCRLQIISMHTKKEVGVLISNRRCTLGSYKGRVARLHTLLYVSALKIVFAPPNSPLDVEIGLHRPQLQTYIAVYQVARLFVTLNRPQNVQVYSFT